jgi:hypothetical protein
MIDFRGGIARVGYVFLFLWEGCWLLFVGWGWFSGMSHWTQEAFLSLLVVLIGLPLGVFLLWRLLLWILSGFIRSR